jgi:serine/threonine protein kinase
MFKPDPDMVCSLENSSTSGQTFSLIMEYLKYGSLMQRLDAGLAKSKLASPQFRCSRKDWSHSSSMFVGVNDWELKVHLALGIARGICAMHREGVWHRDLKSSNVLIKEYNPVEVCAAAVVDR